MRRVLQITGTPLQVPCQNGKKVRVLSVFGIPQATAGIGKVVTFSRSSQVLALAPTGSMNGGESGVCWFIGAAAIAEPANATFTTIVAPLPDIWWTDAIEMAVSTTDNVVVTYEETDA